MLDKLTPLMTFPSHPRRHYKNFYCYSIFLPHLIPILIVSCVPTRILQRSSHLIDYASDKYRSLTRGTFQSLDSFFHGSVLCPDTVYTHVCVCGGGAAVLSWRVNSLEWNAPCQGFVSPLD